MKGKIIHFNQEKSFGFIMGENGENYFFHTSDTNLPFEVSKNKMVSFNTSSNQKGLCAKNIILEKGKQTTHDNGHKSQKQYKQLQPKRKFILISDITVNLNDIKSA
jgi:cold shock CspA family protein